MSDRVSIDLDDFDDDLANVANDLDLDLSELDRSLVGGVSLAATGDEQALTLESILNEDDDLENDEVLKSLSSSLTIMDRSKRDQSETSYSNDDDGSSRSATTSLRTGSISANQYAHLTEKNGIVCKHTQLKQISGQLVVAIERSDAGLPTALAVSHLFAVGTSRGLILLFDANQILKLYITTEYKDAISALSLNNKCDRLLVGNSLGYIFMFDTNNGRLLRKITEAHPYGNAILNLKFTDDPTLATFSDSGGSVFMLEFKRIMGVRSADSTCIFSGSRGEVCHIEPLKFEQFAQGIVDKLGANNARSSTIKKHLDHINGLFNKYSLLAMASFTKIFVVTLRPKLTVLFTFPLVGKIKYLPIINWQFVIVQQYLNRATNNNGADQARPRQFVTPMLSCARESTVYFFQLDYYYKTDEAEQAAGQNWNNSATSPSSKGNSNGVASSKSTSGHKPNGDNQFEIQFKFVLLKKLEFAYKIYNFCWLNAKTIALLDHTEKLHICDIRSNEELQVMLYLPECVQLVYNSCFFKSLSTGGYVSKALAYAGENACYQTFKSHLGQLFMLGTKSITIFSLQNWSSRIDDFINENNLDLALDLALSMYKGDTKALIGLPNDARLRREKITDKITDILYLYVNRAMKQDCPSAGKLDALERHYRKSSAKCVNVCMTIGRQDILFDNLYSLLSCDKLFEGYFFESLEEHILNNKLKNIPPAIIQQFIDYYISNPKLQPNLEKCLIHFDVENIDLHSIMQLCRRYSLLDAFIHLHNKAFDDYVTPLEEVLKMMRPVMFLTYESSKAYLKFMDKDTYARTTNCGNKILVYLCCCLCGQSYPYGSMSDDQLSDRVRRTTFDYLTRRRNKMIDDLLAEEKAKSASPSANEDPTAQLIARHLDDLTNENLPTGDYPIIKIFLHFDVLDFLNVLSMAFNEPSFEAVIGLEKKQHLVNILIEIGLTGTNKGSPHQQQQLYNNRLVGHLFTFLARQIANKNNNIKVDNSIFTQMIEYLCNREELDRSEEREQTLLSLLNSFSMQIVEYFDLDRLLNLALKAKFMRVCEMLYELRGEYYEIVDCYLHPENSLDRQRQVFEVVRGILSILYEQNLTTGINVKRMTISNLNEKLRSFSSIGPPTNVNSVQSIEPRDVQLKKLQDKLVRYETLKQMLQMNPTEAIHLLWTEMNIDLKHLIKTIKNFKASANSTKNHATAESESEQAQSGESELLYRFVKGLFDLVELIKTDRKYLNYMSQFGGEYCELYVELVCQHEPDSLIYILKTILSEYNYRIDECLRICRERQHWDGAAYLLEKSGQIEAAFSLNLEKMISLIKELQKNLEILPERQLDRLKTNIDALLVMIVQLCQRNSCSLNDSVKEKIWFSLFDEVMKPIRGLIIDPSIEALLSYEADGQSELVKKRLNETREFFKSLGSYLINSMVGYLNLTTIIDRMICDPLYGASNFGDIKDLMLKMLEMCSYEQTLLNKTSSLVSRDVYSKMLVYKRLACKSFSSFTNFCQYCSRPLDLTFKKSLNGSIASANMQNAANISSPMVDLNEPRLDALDSKMSVTIYNCGHSFHSSCLEIMLAQSTSTCPLCNSSSTTRFNQLASVSSNSKFKSKYAKKNKSNETQADTSQPAEQSDLASRFSSEVVDGNRQIKASTSQTALAENEPGETSDFNRTNYTQLNERQLNALKSIRSRNMSIYNLDMNENGDINGTSAYATKSSVYEHKILPTNTMIEKRTKLNLAPANLTKFI